MHPAPLKSDFILPSLIAEVIKLCESLYRRILVLHGETYDLELKLCQQDYEINEAVVRINDIKGKL